MKHYDRYFSADEIFALRELAREFDLDGPQRPEAQALFVWSLGRTFLKLWKSLDVAAGGLCDSYTDRDGRMHQVDGTVWKSRTGSVYVGERLKWERRVRAWYADYYQEARHVVDWLHTSFQDRADWLTRVDEHGRPKKLMKCGSLDRLLHEADKAMARAHSLVPNSERAREEVVGTYEGYEVVLLQSPEALDVEGRRMGHCIGHGSYDQRLSDPGLKYASIRKNGVPVATVEAVQHTDGHWYIRQAYGPRNRHVDAEVMDFMVRHLHLRTYAEFRAVERAVRIADQERRDEEQGIRPFRL